MNRGHCPLFKGPLHEFRLPINPPLFFAASRQVEVKRATDARPAQQHHYSSFSAAIVSILLGNVTHTGITRELYYLNSPQPTSLFVLALAAQRPLSGCRLAQH